MSMLLAALVYPSFERIDDQAVVRGLWKRNLKEDKKEKEKYVCPGKVKPYDGPQSSYTSVYAHGILSA